jgi:uncharacterized protein YcgI (DUF1989 family)
MSLFLLLFKIKDEKIHFQDHLYGDMAFSARNFGSKDSKKTKGHSKQTLQFVSNSYLLTGTRLLHQVSRNVNNSSPEVAGAGLLECSKTKRTQIYAVESSCEGHCWYHKTKPTNVSGELITWLNIPGFACVQLKTGLKYYITRHIQRN